jgi:hypothetical protein
VVNIKRNGLESGASHICCRKETLSASPRIPGQALLARLH